MDPKDALNVVRAGWWLLVIGVLAGVAGAGGLILQATPLYTASTQLFVSTTGTDDTSTAYQGNLFSQQRVTSYVELLTGVQVAGRVIEELQLEDTPAELAGSIRASVIPETVLLDVTITRPSATEARDIGIVVGQQFALMVAELETPDSGSASAVKVTVTAPPELPVQPSSPDPTRTVTLGALLGLLAGVAALLLRARMDTTVKTPEDVTRLTQVGVVGALMEDESLVTGHVATDEDNYSETAEAYRQIRTNLQFIDVDHPVKTIVVTSSVPGEGKTTVAVNLALVLAQSGARVALVEADLRRPRVTRYLGMISGAGLSNVLSGSAGFEDLVQPYGNGNLAVLAAGPTPPYPSEMLGSHQMRVLLDEARQNYDFVIIDAPPLLPVTDAAVLSVAADGAIIVARHGVTTNNQLLQAASNLHRIDARLLGVVLNRIPPKAAASYGYGYQYSYSAVPAVDEAGGASVSRRTMPVHTTTFESIGEPRRSAPRVPTR
ncbi:MAG: capsular exopolysaccharide family [Blastococcus sp.]|nr:capsular exopolysaccharide family [Blastococcus sp.]